MIRTTPTFDQSIAKVIQDGSFYLEALDDHSYAAALPSLFGSSIGQHTRHWLEFFQCFIQQSASDLCICYDRRVRDRRLETEVRTTRQVLRTIQDQLPVLPDDTPLTLEARVGNQLMEMPSSVGREKWYLIEHAIHHLAIIKIGLREIRPDLDLPADFGLAYSTIQHQQSIKVTSS